MKGLNRDQGRINSLIEKNTLKERITVRLQQKYKIKQKGLKLVREETKQRIKADSAKIKRYNNRISQYYQNRMFSNNEGKFYEQFNDGGNDRCSDIPDQDEAKKFWDGIWSEEKVHNADADWLKNIKDELKDIPEQEKMLITTEKMRIILKKMPNWKAPGPDRVQGYWLKNFKNAHESLRLHLSECLESATVPDWMTSGRTVLIQKEKSKGNVPSNYRPITCLPLVWKLMTGIVADEIYIHLDENDVLPEEQKGCRRKAQGTNDLLYIDNMTFREVKRRRKNLAIAWIDYKKAYDRIPHSWILECLKNLKIHESVQRFLSQSMKTWKVKLECGSASLGEVAIKRGIFKGDSLSPLLFVMCLIPLTMILRKSEPSYPFATNRERINHLLYMDALKLYAKIEKELDSLIRTVRVFSAGIAMEVGIDKCAMLVVKRGSV